MDRATNTRIGMFRKVSAFLDKNSAVLAINPAIAAVENDLNDLQEQILGQSAIAERRLKGYKEQKQSIRTDLMKTTLQVGSALFAYWLNNNIKNELDASHYSKRSIFRYTDGNLYLRATQLHGKANPVKALLSPYSCAPADVDMLLANKERFLAVVELPKTNRKEGGKARKKVGELLKQSTVLLENLDNQMAVYQSVKPSLHSEYRTARALDKMGGKKKKKDAAGAAPTDAQGGEPAS